MGVISDVRKVLYPSILELIGIVIVDFHLNVLRLALLVESHLCTGRDPKMHVALVFYLEARPCHVHVVTLAIIVRQCVVPDELELIAVLTGPY